MTAVKGRVIVVVICLAATLCWIGLCLAAAVESCSIQRAYIDASIPTVNFLHTRPLPSKTLPLFNETGGLVVFLHVAKTGGTSIRRNFEERKLFPNVRVRRILLEVKLKAIMDEIDFYVSAENTDNQTLILETHGGAGQPMSIFQLHHYVHEWRWKAKANNKNVFFFTILREPTSFYVSYFNYFNHPGCELSWCDEPVMNLTEENLVKSIVPDRQCLYLARKHHNKVVNLEFPVTTQECESAYTLLKADVDWVGTTETMQNSTLPLLTFMLTGDVNVARSFEQFNKVEKHTSIKNPLSLNSLSEESLQRIRLASELDRYLYNSAKRDYQLSMWKNFDGRNYVEF